MQVREAFPQVAKLAILAVVGTFLAWRIVVVNMADFFAQSGDSDDAAAALKWDPTHSDALYAHASSILEKDPALARSELETSIRENPANASAYVALGTLLEKQGDIAGAKRAFATAVQMAPQREDVRGDTAAFWVRQHDLGKAIENWDVVLSFAPEIEERIFPALMAVADYPEVQKAFATLLTQPVSWWPDFFAYVAANSPRLDTVRALYGLQAKGPNDATQDALRAYLERLQHDGYWTESYFVWLNNLDDVQIKNVGNLFNGGFEAPLSNLGFDWISKPAGYILVETAPTYGATESKALHVLFRGPRVAFRHFGEYLMLSPGTYTLHGRARTDDLEVAGNEGGARWVVYCLGTEEPIASTDRFAGTEQWRHFGVPFIVPPDGCPVQMLRLELAGRVALDFQVKGSVWFDDLAVDRQDLD
jgi:tetratricopeptide (TPR) repeat protein